MLKEAVSEPEGAADGGEIEDVGGAGACEVEG